MTEITEKQEEIIAVAEQVKRGCTDPVAVYLAELVIEAGGRIPAMLIKQAS